MKPPKGVFLVRAKYIKDCSFLFTFSNGKESLVDFTPIITYGTSLLKFLEPSIFRKINIDKPTSHIYWGKNWDMCFKIEDYYGETEVAPIRQRGGRKPIADKKVLIRLYVRQSIIKANGGEDRAQQKCTQLLEAAIA
jgi:hypothetical protein